ncbi:MAG: URC4/urg3 family protein [Hyphomicrobiaceae bacterium]|nr:URC4/urg3 family protein [Hyphomicrobiaceae bacterium]
MLSMSAAALSLLSAQAVRERAHRLLALGLDGKLDHFSIDLARLQDAADLVIGVTRRSYPDLDVPFHSRWRHFVVNGEDRWERIACGQPWRDAYERARATFDLATVSVVLDAGAGPYWAYRDPASGARVGRSEGLALASLDMFAAGAFSSDPRRPLRVDAAALQAMTRETLGRHFQVGVGNPLLGVEGRVALLRRLGATVAATPEVFANADGPRPGGLFDHLIASAGDRSVAAPTVLSTVLRHLGQIWPSRLELDGFPLGDCWRHPALSCDDATSGLMPLHKLSQWLTYSLLEPLEWAGLAVTGIDGLTGLAEYRNGGLFIDTGVLALRDQGEALVAHGLDTTLVVEWRALTVALLDRLAAIVRARLGMSAEMLPLAKALQAGTWAAGRQIALRLRPDGAPPLAVVSDGTVF